MEIISGRTGKPHVTSQQFRQIIAGIVGSDSCILPTDEKLEPELASNNILKIRSGIMSHHGNMSSVKIGTYDEVELTNGSQGMKRIDLVVNRYTRNAETNVESNDWIVITGTPDADSPVVPEYTAGNLQEGDLVDDCPVFEIHYDGLNITEVKKLLEIAQSNKDLSNKLTELNGKIFSGIDVLSAGIAEGNVENSTGSADIYTASENCYVRCRNGAGQSVSVGIKTATDYAVLFAGVSTCIIPLKAGQTLRGVGSFVWKAYKTI